MKTSLSISLFALCISLALTGVSVSAPAPSFSQSLDFGWGPPIYRKAQIDEKKGYLAWPIQISNYTGKKLLPLLDIVAVTDTGRQYAPNSKILASMAPGDMLSLSGLHTSIFPQATRRSMVVFEDFDPKINRIHFYIGGLTQASGKVGSEHQKYLQITYTRAGGVWKWEKTGVLE